MVLVHQPIIRLVPPFQGGAKKWRRRRFGSLLLAVGIVVCVAGSSIQWQLTKVNTIIRTSLLSSWIATTYAVAIDAAPGPGSGIEPPQQVNGSSIVVPGNPNDVIGTLGAATSARGSIAGDSMLTERRTSNGRNGTTSTMLLAIFPSNSTTTRRNQQLLTTLSGCHMTRWVYIQPIVGYQRAVLEFPKNRDNPRRHDVQGFRFDDCLEEPHVRRLGFGADGDGVGNNKTLSKGDTIYIPIMKLPFFIEQDLDKVEVPVVIISGQWSGTVPLHQDHISTLLNHPMILAWFCQNIGVNVGGDLSLQHHPKLHPWPYGFSDAPFRHEYTKQQTYANVVNKQQAATNHDHSSGNSTSRLSTSANDATAGSSIARDDGKDTHFFFSHFSTNNNPTARADIPNNKHPSRNLIDYYSDMARARFIFSPDGDRPETYRHY